ncbi:hypothetical protein [Magnetospirillum molischianum]|uniref:hypothetical protein n=1 Tax=Magnetospirillum molischianum TaxID=1083 RepID=UPI00031FB888|nr:hypothetical protein [Magnetospirillum molischianum]
MTEKEAAEIEALIESLSADSDVDLERQVRHVKALERRRQFRIIKGGLNGRKDP